MLPRSLILSALGLTLLSSACVISPNDEQAVFSRSSPVLLFGYGPRPTQTLNVFASTSSSGPWSVIGTVQTAASPSTYGGRSLYGFSRRFAVPTAHWKVSNGCSAYETFVGVGTTQPGMITFDHDAVASENPVSCLQRNNYDASKCAGRSSPIARLRAEHVASLRYHAGDLVLRDDADVARYRCLSRLDGSLTIAETVRSDFELPDLRTVNGDLVSDYFTAKGTGGIAYRLYLGKRAFPRLETVSGDLLLRADYSLAEFPPWETASQNDFEVEMPRLRLVEGSVLLTMTGNGNNVYPKGLHGLTRIGGNVEVYALGPDHYPNLFDRLTRVGGDVTLQRGKIHGYVFPELTDIGGDLRTPFSLRATRFPKLTRVRGNAYLRHRELFDAGRPTGRTLTALVQVDGTLEMVSSVSAGFERGARPVQVSRLRIASNPNLARLEGSDVQVVGSGDIVITDNPELCDSVVTRFVAAQTQWTGTAVVRNNRPGC